MLADHGGGEKAVRGGVGLQNPVLVVEHHHAGAHAGHDLPVERLQPLDRHALAGGDGLAALQPLGDLLDDQRHHEEGDAEQARFGELERVLVAGLGGEVELLEHHRQGGQRGDQETHAAAQQNIAGGHVDQQQHRQAAFQAAVGVHHQAQHQHINNQRQRLREARFAQPLAVVHRRGHQRQQQIARHRAFEQSRHVLADQPLLAHIEQRQQHRGDGDAVEVVDAAWCPALARAHGAPGIGADGPGCRTPCCCVGTLRFPAHARRIAGT